MLRAIAFLIALWMMALVLLILIVTSPGHASSKSKTKIHPGTKVEAWSKVPQLKCLEPIRVVGSQDIREDAAEESAKKAWAELVRWDSGEAYMAITNAKDYQRRCSRSSIGEALGAVLNRCEIIATPCRPALMEGVTK